MAITTAVCWAHASGRFFAETCWEWRSASHCREYVQDPTPPIKWLRGGGWWFIPFGIGPNKSLDGYSLFTLDAMTTDLSSAFCAGGGIYLNSNLKNEKHWLGDFIFKFVCLKRQIDLRFSKKMSLYWRNGRETPLSAFGGLALREWILDLWLFWMEIWQSWGSPEYASKISIFLGWRGFWVFLIKLISSILA